MPKRVLLLVAIFLPTLVSTAHAYLDPATGSMLLQLLVGGVAGAAVLIKLYWRRFVQLFSPKNDDDDGRPA